MEGLNFSENVSRLRKSKKITQEELAEFLGVTKTSVSKWETGTTMPDILMLPQIAAYFDISIDKLLGYEPQLTKRQIQIYYHKLSENFANNKFEEVLEESEALVKKYYSCYGFLQQIAILWINQAMSISEIQKRNYLLEKVVDISDHILDGCKDIVICENIIAIKAMAKLQCGKADEVIELIEDEKMNVNYIKDKGSILTLAYYMIGDFNKAQKSAQIGMYRGMMDMIEFGINLLSIKKEDKKYCFEIINRLDTIMESFQIFKLNPNTYGVYNYQVAKTLCGFVHEGNKELEELIYKRIKLYVNAIIKLFDDNISLHGDEFFSKLDDWFDELDLGIEAVRSENAIMKSAIESLKIPDFEVLHNKELIKAFILQLENLRVK